MKPGDILTDKEGKRWLLYEILGSFLCVTDVETNKLNDARLAEDIIKVESKPDNVTYLMMFKRSRNVADIEGFLCS